MNRPIVIYHANCADGFTAAWCFWRRFPDFEYYPGVYGAPPPDVKDRDVYMVDFSYKLSVMEQIRGEARRLVILDHHKSAYEDLKYFECDYKLFDMQRSGAGIAWDYVNPGVPRPPLVDHVEDRDLWRFSLRGTREFQAAVFSYSYTFENWERLAQTPPADLIREGEGLERKHFKDIEELLRICKRRMNIAGFDVPVASLPYTMSSDAGNIMASNEPFAACYWDSESKRHFSLRSVDGGEDVSRIALLFGGGGHMRAAGFAVPRSHELARS